MISGITNALPTARAIEHAPRVLNAIAEGNQKSPITPTQPINRVSHHFAAEPSAFQGIVGQTHTLIQQRRNNHERQATLNNAATRWNSSALTANQPFVVHAATKTLTTLTDREREEVLNAEPESPSTAKLVEDTKGQNLPQPTTTQSFDSLGLGTRSAFFAQLAV